MLPRTLRSVFLAFLIIAPILFGGASSALAATNLIQNPSLESGTNAPDSWQQGTWGTNSTVFSYPVAGRTGAKAVQVTVSSWTDGDSKWFPNDVSVTAGKQYTISDYYTANVGTALTIRYQLADNSYQYAYLGAVPAAATWQQFSATITVPANVVRATVFHVLQSTGTLTVDDFVFEENAGTTPAPTPTPTPTPTPSAILNPGFETGSGATPDGWTRGEWGDLTATYGYPVAGSGSARAASVTLSRYVSGDAKWIFTPIAATPGKVLRFSDSYTSNIPSNVTLQIKKSDGSFQYFWIGDAPASASWTTFQGQFTVPAGAVELTIFHAISAVGTLTVDNFALADASTPAPAPTPTTVGMVTLTFDDSYANQFQNAVPKLNAAGIKAGFYVITGEVGNSGSMTWAQLTQMKNAGHEIGSHTVTHPHLPQLSTANARAELVNSKNTLISKGFNPETFVYPYGEYTASVKQLVKDSGYIGARSVDTGFNVPSSDKYLLMDQHIENTTTLATIKSQIDQAIAQKKWLIFELHAQLVNCGSEQYCNTPTLLQGMIDYIKLKGVKTVTLSEGLKLMP